MKTLRAKQISMRTMVVAGFALALIAVMAFSQEAAVMTGGWGTFKTQISDFFYKGLGGDGAQGIGITIAVIGVLLAAISFVVHKFNPQSRMPGWITCLVVALIGSLLFTGVEPVIKIITKLRDIFLGWFGFGKSAGFGDYS